MDAPTVLALFFLVVFVLGLLVAPIIWRSTAVHDRKEREQAERNLIQLDPSRHTALEGGSPMPTYVTLLRYTSNGIQKVKDSPTRLEAAKQSMRAMGGELKAFYLVMGQYDAVVITEAPNDETAAGFALATGARGFVQTETLRAFTEEEYRKILAGLA